MKTLASPLRANPCDAWPAVVSRMTDQAAAALKLAHGAAVRHRQGYIGTEHMLVGLIEEGGLAAQVLMDLGVDVEHVRERALEVMSRGRHSEALPLHLPITPRGVDSLAKALEEAGRSGHARISTDHLLLGLLRGGGVIASDVLRARRVTLRRARRSSARVNPPRVQ